MLRLSKFTLPALCVLAPIATAQVATIRQGPEPRVVVAPRGEFNIRLNSTLSASRLGMSVSSTTTPRDTLGLLVSSVTAGGVAERAGIIEGSRIRSINGVNLALHSADAGQSDMQGIMARRFQRELAKLRSGDTVSLSLFADGQTREVKVATEPPMPISRVASPRAADMNRATLGAIVGGTPSPRDSLGLLVVEVAEDGPLAKSQIYEGSRIAAINGVDLRVIATNATVASSDRVAGRATAPPAGRGAGSATARGGRATVTRVAPASTPSAQKAELLVAELAKLNAGDRVELRVYDNGRFRNVSVATARFGDVNMPSGGGNMFMFGDGNMLEFNNLGRARQVIEQHAVQLDSMLHNARLHVRERIRVDTTGKR